MHRSLRPIADLPRLDDPLVIVSLWGGDDITRSAAEATRYLRDQWGAREIATVDPDRFYDFTVARPRRQGVGDESTIRWPGARFYTARPPGAQHDVIFLAGREPSLRWHEFTAVVVDFMQAVDAHRLLAVGSRPDKVPHTRPAPVVLSNASEHFERLLGLQSKPDLSDELIGVQTVLSMHLQQLGMDTAQLTALVPGYVNVGPSPRAALSLLEHLNRAVGASTQLPALRDEIEAFDRHAEETIDHLGTPRRIREHVRELEEQYDATHARDDAGRGTLPTADEFVAGAEDLLREHREEEADDKT